MEKKLNLIPIWLWVAIIVIIVLLCSCRGGRSLGSGSVGTVIVPQTPEQMNERVRQPPPKLTTPIIITPPVPPPVVITPPPVPPKNITVTPTPVPPKNVTIKPKIPVITEGEVKLPPATPVAPAPKVDEKVNIKLAENNDDEVITLDTREENGFPEEKPFINWGELISYWLFVVLMVVFGWIVYDTVVGFIKEKKLQNEEDDKAKKAQENLIKKPAKATRKSRKKAISKKGKK